MWYARFGPLPSGATDFNLFLQLCEPLSGMDQATSAAISLADFLPPDLHEPDLTTGDDVFGSFEGSPQDNNNSLLSLAVPTFESRLPFRPGPRSTAPQGDSHKRRAVQARHFRYKVELKWAFCAAS